MALQLLQGSDSKKVCKYLPPVNLHETYEHYAATLQLAGHKLVSFSTFCRVFCARWADVLKYRDRSIFARCEVCFQLTQQINDRNVSLEGKLGTTKDYCSHLHAQYVDRSVAWSLQELSKDHHSDTLCLMRWIKQSFSPALRVAKHIHPTLKIHGCWCFGWTLDLHVMDEVRRHDSSCIIEIVARCLERISQKARTE